MIENAIEPVTGVSQPHKASFPPSARQVDYFDIQEAGMGRVGAGGLVGIVEMFPDFFPAGAVFRVRSARARTRCELLELRKVGGGVSGAPRTSGKTAVDPRPTAPTPLPT